MAKRSYKKTHKNVGLLREKSILSPTTFRQERNNLISLMDAVHKSRCTIRTHFDKEVRLKVKRMKSVRLDVLVQRRRPYPSSKGITTRDSGPVPPLTPSCELTDSTSCLNDLRRHLGQMEETRYFNY